MIWSPRSNLSRLTDPNGTVIDYTYDLLDRCVRKDIAVGPGVAATTTFEEFSYDGLSRLVRGTNNTSMIEYSYDSLGNRARAKADCIAAFATYDGEGNRLSLTLPGGRQVQWTYDALDRVLTVGSALPGGAFISHATFAYDGPDRLARIGRANGINTRIFWNGLQNSPNSAGDFGFQQVSRINHAKAGGSPVIDQRAFAFDRNQNKILRAQTAGFSAGAPTTTNMWSYDALDRLVRSTRTHGSTVEADNTYVIDALGNRTNVIRMGFVEVYDMNPALPDPGDFQMNQYTGTPFGQQLFDHNGNLIQRAGAAGATVYHYDYADRLVSVENSSGPVAGFNYDVLGRRISKTTHPPAPAAPVTTQFLHDPDSDSDSIVEVRQNGGVIATFVLPEVDDEVLVAFTAANTAAYFHSDDLGNVVALTDEAGNVLERYDYDDYGAPGFFDAKGAPLQSGGQLVTSSPLGNPFLFRGMFWDGETQLYHEGSRNGVNPFYEDPRTGRCLNRQGGRCANGDCAAGRCALSFAGENPWTGEPVMMKKGTVKFFNETKGFGRMAGGGGGGGRAYDVMFNPREYSICKVTVRGWDPQHKREIVGVARKEEGGRHTPFHNKYRASLAEENELGFGRDMRSVHNNPLYEDSGMSGSNPLYQGKERKWRPGRPTYGNITFESGKYAIDPKVQKKWLPANFRLREGGRTVGAGQVVEIIK